MKTKISQEQARLLLANEETRDLVAHLLPDDQSKPAVHIEGTPEEFDVLRDACSDLLLRIGFDAQYVATREGNLLEDLIDKLYVG